MSQDIIELVKDKEAQSRRSLRRGVIITPGAVGDCLLMLPLAKFMKEVCRLDGIEFIGHTEYIDFYPGRTCVDCIRSIDSIDFHRLFADAGDFDVEDPDALIAAFDRYAWIVSFLGEGNQNFEHNLIYTVHCSHSAEVTTLPLAAGWQFRGHISQFYIRRFNASNTLWVAPPGFSANERLIHPTRADICSGQSLLQAHGVDPAGRIVVIHPGSGSKEKCWHLDNFCRLAETLAARQMQPVFLLGPAELDRFDNDVLKMIEGIAKSITGLSLAEVVQILSCTNLYIGNDSGITHLAAGVGTLTLAVFGPTDPALYSPIGPGVTVLNQGPDGFTKKSAKSVQQVTEALCRVLSN
jgi:hypothetical protein